MLFTEMMNQHPVSQKNHHQNLTKDMKQTLKNLSILCRDHRHILPSKMAFLTFDKTTNGDTVAMYQCAMCGTKHAWGIDKKSGEPRMIFQQVS